MILINISTSRGNLTGIPINRDSFFDVSYDHVYFAARKKLKVNKFTIYGWCNGFLSRKQKIKYYKLAAKYVFNNKGFACHALNIVLFEKLLDTDTIKRIYPEFRLFEPDDCGLNWFGPISDLKSINSRIFALLFCVEICKDLK